MVVRRNLHYLGERIVGCRNLGIVPAPTHHSTWTDESDQVGKTILDHTWEYVVVGQNDAAIFTTTAKKWGV